MAFAAVLQALEAAKKQLRAKEADLAAAVAEAEAAAGERTKLEEQIKVSITAVTGGLGTFKLA